MKLCHSLLIGIVLSQICHAETVPSLEESIQSQIAGLENALELPPSGAPEPEEWYLQNFWIRGKLPVGFVIPGIVTLQVIPEMEFLIQRQLPEDWQLYHPF